MLKAVNARTGVADYEFEATTDREIDAIATELRSNQPAWSNSTIEHRAGILESFAQGLLVNAAEILPALIADSGWKNLSFAQMIVMKMTVMEAVANYKTITETDELKESGKPGLLGRSQLVPYQLVGNIGPWNFPLSLSLMDAIPALAAGSAVIVKPSEVTPRWIEPVSKLIESTPELHGVFRLIKGDGAVGAALIDRVDMVTFTGSVDTGKKVAEAAGRRFIPLSLELGGKDAVIVTDNADIEKAATTILKGAISVNGQSCMAVERVYVHENVYDDFVNRLVEKANGISINYPDISGGHLGPFIDPRQPEKVAAQISDAVQKGARVLTGGDVIDHGGKWMLPTVVVDVDHSMDIMTKETFGPTIPVMKVASNDDAIQLANDTEYGLSGAVYSADLNEANTIASALEAGTISINDISLQAATHKYIADYFNFSGLGRTRLGIEGVARFLRRKAIIANTANPASFQESYYSEKDDERSAQY